MRSAASSAGARGCGSALGNLETRAAGGRDQRDRGRAPDLHQRPRARRQHDPARDFWPGMTTWCRTAIRTIRSVFTPLLVEPADRAHADPRGRRRRNAPTGTGSRSARPAPRRSKRSSGWPSSRTCTRPRQSDVLDEQTAHPQFEAFYREHIRKLLRVRGGRRYLSKGNYNVTRLEYLLKLFPDARFVVPVRDPVWHIASLMKQHALFCEGCSRHPEAVRHLQRVGHFEFGLDRRPINAGDPALLSRVASAWGRGDELRGLVAVLGASLRLSGRSSGRQPGAAGRRAGRALRGHVPRSARYAPAGPDPLPARCAARRGSRTRRR